MSPRSSLATLPWATSRITTAAWLCALLLVAALAGAAPSPAVAAPAVPLPHYDLQVTLDYDGASLRAQQVVRFYNVTGQPLKSVVFHSMAGGMGLFSLDAAQVDDQDVAASFDASGSVFELPLTADLVPGEAVQVRLAWSERIPRVPDRLSATQRAVSLGNWFPTLAVHQGDWDRRPYTPVGDAFFTEVADFDVRLDLSRPAVVAFTGQLVAQEGTYWEMTAQSVRDFALAISPDYQQVDVQMDAGPLVSAYVLNPSHAQPYLETIISFANLYQTLVGPYPYPTLRLAETDLPTGYAGMEYPQLVMIAGALSTDNFARSLARNVVAHEVAHQWFYGLIGDDQLRDPWLDEAFATYLVQQGYEQLSPELAAQEDRSGLAPAGPGEPIDQSVFDFPGDPPYFQAVYRRGGRFLAELRRTMGDGPWTSFLQSLYQTYRGKAATPRAVLDLAQQAAPALNLNPLISSYTRYGAFTYPEPRCWSFQVPASPWQGQVAITIDASFPVTALELWLDDRQVAEGAATGTYSVDVSPVPAGDYVLLARLTDEQGAIFERATRVTLLP